MKRSIGLMLLGIFLLSNIEIGFAANDMDDAATDDSDSGSSAATVEGVVKFEGFRGEDVRARVRERHEKVRDDVKGMRDEWRRMKDEKHAKLKELKEQWKIDRAHFNYDEYYKVVDEYLNALNKILDYLKELRPNERGVAAMEVKINHAKDLLKSLPKEPSKDQIREVWRALKDVKHFIMELKKALHDARRETREGGHEGIVVKLQAFSDMLKARGVPGDLIDECLARARGALAEDVEMREGMMHDAIACFRRLQPQEA